MKHKFLFSVFTIFFIFVFIALGTWQIIRLNWKNNLILEIEESLKNPKKYYVNNYLKGKKFFENCIKYKINNYISFLSTSSIFGKEIITEVKKIDKFYYAEEYHQDYEKKNPYNPYVQNVSIPRFNRFKQKASSYIKIKDDH